MPVVHLSTGKTFETHGGESVLDAALRAGITLPYSCRTGRCGSCKAGLVSGDTSLLHAEMELSEEERAAGSILTCVRTATSDIALAVEDLGDAHLAAARTWPCRLQSIERASPDVVRATLRLPPASTFTFAAGQYIDVIGHGGVRRSYSLAAAQAEAMPLELHVRQVPGGVMSEYWFGQARTNDLLRLHGPLGTFFVRETEGMHLVFLATGTGIAPVKAMLEELARRADQPLSVTVYWGGRVPSDLYWQPAPAGPAHRFVPVLSRAGPDWPGERGHVQDALLRDGCDWQRTVVYACGSDAMIHAARARLLGAGLPARHFHSDAFVSSAPA